MQNDNTVFKIDDEYSFLTKELLEKEYIENKLTDRKIAEKYNIRSKVTVWRRRKFFNIGNSNPNKSNNHATKNRKFSISESDAIELISSGISYDDIASKIGCSRMVAYRRLKELNLIDDQDKALNKLKWHEKLTDLQERFLMGCLLGDGNITPSGMFQCNHSYKQLQYIEYKQKILSNFISPNFTLRQHDIHNNQNGKTYHAYYMRTMQNEFLKCMYSNFYENGIKIFPYDFLINSTFDSYSLAIWFMDDGSLHQKSARLHTFGFGYDGNLRILEFLHKKFDVIGRMQENKGKNEKLKWDIIFNVEQSKKFFSVISKHILPIFQYKLPSDYKLKESNTVAQNNLFDVI